MKKLKLNHKQIQKFKRFQLHQIDRWSTPNLF